MSILRRHKKTAVKPVRGRRRTSGDAGGALSTFGGSLIALESRIMFDGAAVATASTVSTAQVVQNQAEVSHSAVDGASAETAPAVPTSESQPTTGDVALFDALAAY